jgi:hypothetical protein
MCVSRGAMADRGALQGPPTYITLMEDLRAYWKAREATNQTGKVQ